MCAFVEHSLGTAVLRTTWLSDDAEEVKRKEFGCSFTTCFDILGDWEGVKRAFPKLELIGLACSRGHKNSTHLANTTSV